MLPQSGLYPVMAMDVTVPEAQPVDFREIAIQFVRITMLFQLLEHTVFMNSTYFAIQGQNKCVYIVCGVMAATNLLANYIFVSVLGLGVEGLGIAAVTGRIFAFATSSAICFKNIKSGQFPWEGFSRVIFLGWKPMVKLGMCGVVFIFVDISLFQISSFFSQFVNTITLSTIIILMQFMAVSRSLVIAISLTASNLIGQALAEGCVSKVRKHMRLTLFNTVLALVPLISVSYSMRKEIVMLFTHNPEVIDLFIGNFWLAVLGLGLEFVHMSMNYGILTAFAQQSFAASVSCVSYYLIGIPFIITSIFLTDLGLTGILIGWIMADMILLLAAV